MSTLAQLDAEIAAETTEDATLVSIVTTIDNDITTLLAKLAAGEQVDVSKELAAIQANVQTVTGAVTSLASADASVNPPPAPQAKTS